MLYHLFEYLKTAGIKIPGGALFQFITFRVLLAVILSLVITMLFGRKMINYLMGLQVGESVRELGLEGEQQKKGTPTMGGILIVSVLFFSTVLWTQLDSKLVQVLGLNACASTKTATSA